MRSARCRIAAVVLSPGRGLRGRACSSRPTRCAPTRPAASDGAAAAANAFLEVPARRPARKSPASRSMRPNAWRGTSFRMDRVGVSLLKLDDAQSELLGPLLATALSPEGLLAARGVMKHENILRRVETEAGVANASRRDPGLYYTAVFGKPAAARALGLALRRPSPLASTSRSCPAQPPVVGAGVHGRESRARARGTQRGLPAARRRRRSRPRADHACCPAERRKVAIDPRHRVLRDPHGQRSQGAEARARRAGRGRHVGRRAARSCGASSSCTSGA